MTFSSPVPELSKTPPFSRGEGQDEGELPFERSEPSILSPTATPTSFHQPAEHCLIAHASRITPDRHNEQFKPAMRV